MTAAAARITVSDLCRTLGPTRKRSCVRLPIPVVLLVDKPEIFPLDPGKRACPAQYVLVRRIACKIGIGRQQLPCPPRAERVVQQKLNHIRLSEELRHGRQFDAADFDPGLFYRLIDELSLGGAPKLIGPAERIVRGKDLFRELRDEAAQAQ